MNKSFAKHVLFFFLFLTTICYAGCGQLTTVDFQTPIIDTVTPSPFQTLTRIIPTITATRLHCAPQEPTTDLEKIAETWFLSPVSQIPARSEYEFVDAGEFWGYICAVYQDLLLKNDQTAYSPIDLSLQVITESASQNIYQVDSVVAVAVNSENLLIENVEGLASMKDRDIVTVVVSQPSFDWQSETRIDFVFENGMWQIRWVGTRHKCISSTDSEWHTGNLDCP